MMSLKNVSFKTKLMLFTLSIISLCFVGCFMILQFLSDGLYSANLKIFDTYTQTLQYNISAQFFERYGDAQAFAASKSVQELNRKELDKLFDHYVKLYGIYDVILAVDLNGNLIASNQVNANGNKINFELIKNYNFKNEKWFQSVVNQKFTDDTTNGLYGTYVENPHFDPITEKVTGKKSYGSSFSALIKNKEGKPVGVLSNRANAKWFVDEFINLRNVMSASGLSTAEYTLLDKSGNIIFEYDPTYKKSEEVIYDESILGKFNLAEKGVESAVRAVAGKSGNMLSHHARKGITQLASYRPILEKKFVHSLGWSVLVRDSEKNVFAAIEKAKKSFLIFTIIFLGLTTAAGLWFANNISVSIQKISNRLNDFAQSIGFGSVRISDVAGKLGNVVTDSAVAIEKTVSSSTEIATTVEQATKLAGNAAADTETMVDYSRSGLEAVKSIEASMDNISDGNQKIFEQIENGNQELQKIVSMIEDIKNKAKVIDDIVFQTKLLSFNASVEAARAGDHGKGFSVVAEEVGKLAQMSGVQSKEISSLLDSRTQEIKSIIERNRHSSEEVASDVKIKLQDGVETIQKCSDIFTKISNQCQKVSNISKEISQSSEVQCLGVSQITNAISSISVVTNQAKEIANVMTSTSGSIGNEINQLNAEVSNLIKIVNGEKAA